MRFFRRQLLIALVQLGAIAWGSVLPARAGMPQRYSYSEVHMGAPWQIVLYAADENTANRAAKAAYARVANLNRVLSDYDPDSELSRLSATAGTGKSVELSDDLWRVLQFSQRLAESSGGAFDVTCGPLTKLWRRARRQKELPKPELLAKAREATGYRAIALDEKRKTALLAKPNMRLDLGGIGMGFAVDEALQVLKAEGITSAMIDASGDIGVLDAPPGKTGWRIGIAPLSGEGAPSRYVWLANSALTISGDAFQSVEIGGKRYSHIVDPHTGLGLTERSAVTVIARDCTTADSYATAVSVMGPEGGMKLIEATPEAAAFIVSQQHAGNVVTRESIRFAKFADEKK